MKSKTIKMLAFSVAILTIVSLSSCKNVDINTTEWKNANNVYRLYIQTPESQLDLVDDEALSDMFEAFLMELEQKNQLFIIDSSNFNELDGKKIYAHNKESMEEMAISFDENIDPNGKRITVNMNYFKMNPIETVNGISIEESLAKDDNTINILVPNQYRVREEEIVALYKSFFCFQKVKVENIYNEEIGRPLNTVTEDDLDVNIIYTKDNQNYFTFNPRVLSETKNIIVDPIVIIYEYKVHSSYAYSYAGTGSFFESDRDAEETFDEIKPEIEKIEGFSKYILGLRLASEHHLPFK